MLKNSVFVASLSVAFFTACKTTDIIQVEKSPYYNIEVNGKLYSAVFQQTAAEYHALCIQAFNVARWRLDEILKEDYDKPLAIVTDIDETFLDNSPYTVKMARKGKVFDEESWNDWTRLGDALPLSGSHEFFDYAASKGVEIFYITNRNQNNKKGTLKNLQKYNYPYADDSHLIVRDKESSKESRRQKLSTTHEIVLLIGDNLSDFSDAFDHKNLKERLENVKNNSTLFGSKFIVLPNTGYGDWESALFDYKRDWSTRQKDSIYNSKLKTF